MPAPPAAAAAWLARYLRFRNISKTTHVAEDPRKSVCEKFIMHGSSVPLGFWGRAAGWTAPRAAATPRCGTWARRAVLTISESESLMFTVQGLDRLPKMGNHYDYVPELESGPALRAQPRRAPS